MGSFGQPVWNIYKKSRKCTLYAEDFAMGSAVKVWNIIYIYILKYCQSLFQIHGDIEVWSWHAAWQ